MSSELDDILGVASLRYNDHKENNRPIWRIFNICFEINYKNDIKVI